jgi:Cu/Ag efflux protein CusF
MKKIILIILSLALLFSFSESAFADREMGTATGQVTFVDSNSSTITIKEEKTAMDTYYKIYADTTFVEGDALKSFKDLKVGDRVTIIYKSVGGANYAKTVSIKK